jgi:hypothetical protein
MRRLKDQVLSIESAEDRRRAGVKMKTEANLPLSAAPRPT